MITAYPLVLARVLAQSRLAPDTLRKLQDQRLRDIVLEATTHVPYYRELFRRAGVSPGDIRGTQDLARIPITTKAELRAAGDRAWSSRYDGRNLKHVATSGTTGQPLVVALNGRDIAEQHATLFRCFLHLGMRPWDRCIKVGLRPHSETLASRLGLYRTLILDSRRPFEEIVAELRRRRPTMLLILPSWLRALAFDPHFRLRDVARPRLVLYTSEVLYPAVATRVEEEWGVRPFSLYGSIESGIIGLECATRTGLHVQADNVLFEVTDVGETDAGPGIGRAVVTSLVRSAMPILRYRLDDLVEAIPGDCPCGSSFPRIGAPLGRDYDPIRLPDGGLRSPMVLGQRLRIIPEVRQYRITQDRSDHIWVEIESDTTFPAARLASLGRDLGDNLSAAMRVDVRVVSRLPDIPGKQRDFVQALAPPAAEIEEP